MRGAPLLVALLLTLACERAPEAAPPPPPNVLLVSIDTLRADHLEAYGYHRETAPRLAELARQGALFERCLAVSNWTLPTHTTLFTGLHPVVHGVEEHRDQLDPARATLGERFAAAGYETAGWYSNPFVGERFGFARGFATYEMALTPELRAASFEKQRTPKGALTRSHQPEPGPRAQDYFVEQSAEPVTDQALRFLDQRDPSRPFLLFLHYNDVHSDYIPPAPYDRMFNPDYQGTLTAEDYPRNKRVHRRMPAEDLEQVKALYDGEIAWVDEHLGRVFERLEALGLAEDTLVVITADHGEGFFEHGGKEHHYGLYRELVEIPLIVRYPARVPAGQRIGHGVSQADIAPTLLDLAGLPPLEEADGQSWAPSLTGEGQPPPRRPVLSRAILKPILDEDGDVVVSLRTDGVTAVHSTAPDGTVTVEVYDTEADPGETRPLPPDHPDVARSLRLLEALHGALQLRGQALGGDTSDAHLDDDPALLEQMRQWGYIR